MVVIFGLLFFLLWKFGFPIITQMVDKRSARIDQSLKDAREIESRMGQLAEEHARMLDGTRREQAAILREASETKNRIIADAKDQAREEAQKLVTDARLQIAAEKEAAMRDIRKEVAVLSVSIAEQILRKELSKDGESQAYIDRMVDETLQNERTS